MPKVRCRTHSWDPGKKSRPTELQIMRTKAEKGVVIVLEGRKVFLNERSAMRLADKVVDQIEGWVPQDDTAR